MKHISLVNYFGICYSTSDSSLSDGYSVEDEQTQMASRQGRTLSVILEYPDEENDDDEEFTQDNSW